MARKKKSKAVELDEMIDNAEEPVESVPFKASTDAPKKSFVAAKNFRTGGILYTKGQELPESFEKFLSTGAVIAATR